MSIVRPLRLVLIALSFASSISVAGLRAGEVSPLDLVGESAALCLEVPRLAETWKRVEQSRMAGRVKAFPPFERFVRGPGFQQWTFIEKFVAQATGQPLSEQLLGLCSESLVVAVYLPEGAKPQGVLIARARDSAALKQAVDSWGKLEPKHLDTAQQHRGQSYIRRAKSPESKEVLYYTVFDRTLVLSDQEALVRQAIDFQQAAAARAESREPTGATGAAVRTLRESPPYRTARARLRDDSIAFVHVNARAWDKALREGAKNDPDAVPVLRVWRHVSALAGSLRFDEGLALDVVAELDRERLPSGWTQFVQSSRAASGWGERIPSDAILAVSGRMDVRPLVQMWLAATPDAKSDDFARGRRVLRSLLAGRDLFEDVLPAVLSDVTIHASEQPNVAAGVTPFELLGSMAWRPSREAASPVEPPLPSSLDNALQFGLNFLAGYFAHELPESNVSVSSETSGGTTIRWLKGLAPWEPAYGVVTDRLVVASSRACLLRGLGPAASNVTEPRPARLARHEQRFFPTATQLVWFDSAQSREALTRHSDWIATLLSRRSPESKPQAAARLSHLGEVLQLFDAAFLAGSLADDHVRVVFGCALD